MPFRLVSEKCYRRKAESLLMASRVLNSAEHNYPISERECPDFVCVLKKFLSCFSEKPVAVNKDHSALVHLTTGKHFSICMIRWALKIAEFNVKF